MYTEIRFYTKGILLCCPSHSYDIRKAILCKDVSCVNTEKNKVTVHHYKHGEVITDCVFLADENASLQSKQNISDFKQGADIKALGTVLY